MRIPYVGPIAAYILVSPIGEQIQSKVSQTVGAVFYEGFDKIRPVATKMVETIMEQSRSIFTTVKNLAKNMVTA